MTARRALPRAPRTPPRGRPHVRPAVPSQEARLRRGPKPPDAAIRILLRALPREDSTDLHQDAAFGAAWKRALSRAWTSLATSARRGVVGALRGAFRERAQEAPAPGGARQWGAATTEAVRVAASPESAIAAAVLAEHASQVQEISIAAGVARYLWTTQLDERVRPLHQKLEGTVQRWDNPPLAGLPSYHAHPGVAGGCRCQAFPWTGT